MQATKIVGQITREVICLLNLSVVPCSIFWGESNRKHVESNHPGTYQKYGATIGSIIASVIGSSDYIGYRNDAIEYIKNMPDGEILKVAIRPSKRGVYFARTIYPIQQSELENFLANNTLVKTG
jgi:hypothetical protein